jgi:ElaB/YqjD/DUF883 family membrane-anchored ribosome-binding protein
MAENGDNLRKKASDIGASLYEGSGVSGRAQQMAETVSDAYESATDRAMAARDYASSLTNDIEQTVRRNPLVSVLAALGVGLIIGSMVRH